MTKLSMAFVALCALVSTAHAESRAWTAAKKVLPSGLQVVGGASIASLKASQLYQQLSPTLMAQAGDPDKLAKLKAACGFDPTSSFDSAVFGLDASQDGAIIIALKGTTQADLEKCLQKAAKADSKTVTISKDGAYTTYTGLGDKPILVRWLGKDTLAVGTKPDDKSALTAATSGGITKDKALASALASVKTDAALWAVVAKPQELDPGVTMNLAYGTADLKSGNVAADVHLQFDSEATAKKAAASTQTKLDDAKKSGMIPAQYSSLLSTIKITSAGAQMIIDASVPETLLLGLAGSALGGH